MESEQLCLQWNDFQTNINSAFRKLREDKDFNDVTLACEDGTQIESHKVILAASSPVLDVLLKRNKHNHPLIIMRGVKSIDLLAIIDFLYLGEANVFQENLDSFLAIAEELQLKGLMEETECQENAKEISEKVVRDRSQTTERAQQPVQKNGDRKIAKYEEFSKDFSELEVRIKSMMEMSANLVSSGKQKAHICKVCGKEGWPNDIRRHIEAKHLGELSFPCNLCEKKCRSRHALRQHKNGHDKKYFC